MQVQRIRMNQLSSTKDGFEIGKAFENLFRTQPLTSANLRIQGGSASPAWQTQNAVLYLVDGVLCSVAAQASQAVPSVLTWSAVASTFQAGAFLVTVDAAGTVRTIPTNVSAASSAAQALAGVVWPSVPVGQVVLGVVVIANSAANVAFTAGTTNLDAANITTTFANLIDALYPSAPL